MEKELIILSVLMVIAVFVISGCSSGEAIKGVRKDVSLKTSEPVKTVRNQSFCNDTDFGIKPFVHGVVFSLNGTHNDSCKNNHAVTEYYCNGTEARSTYIDCENLSPNGICQGGICINGSSNNQTNTTCIDSDGGLNYYEYGFLTLSQGGHSYDACVNASINNTNVTLLSERYCTPSGGIGVFTFSCPIACANGACINNGTIPHNVSVMNNTINATR